MIVDFFLFLGKCVGPTPKILNYFTGQDQKLILLKHITKDFKEKLMLKNYC
jgi:hypothetical protein